MKTKALARALAPWLVLAVAAGTSEAQLRREFAREEPGWSLEAGARAFERSDLDQGGDVSLTRISAGIRHTIPSKTDRATFAFHHEESRYRFGNGAVLSVPRPFEVAKEDSVRFARAGTTGDRTWFWALEGLSGREQGQSLSDSLYAKGGVGVLWRVGERLDLGIGLFARLHLEDDLELLPVPLIEYRASEALRIGIVRSTDPGFGLTYRVSPRLDVYAGLHFDQRQYRLKDKGLLVDAAAVDEETGVRVGLLWKGDGLNAELFGGIAQRELTIDSDRNEVASDDVDASGLVGFALSLAL